MTKKDKQGQTRKNKEKQGKQGKTETNKEKQIQTRTKKDKQGQTKQASPLSRCRLFCAATRCACMGWWWSEIKKCLVQKIPKNSANRNKLQKFNSGVKI